jgi:hypothetical protein
MRNPNSFGKSFQSSKSTGKGNKTSGKGHGYNFEDAGGRSKGPRPGPSFGKKGARKATRSTDGRTGGNKQSGGKDNPFHTAARLANSA